MFGGVFGGVFGGMFDRVFDRVFDGRFAGHRASRCRDGRTGSLRSACCGLTLRHQPERGSICGNFSAHANGEMPRARSEGSVGTVSMGQVQHICFFAISPSMPTVNAEDLGRPEGYLKMRLT